MMTEKARHSMIFQYSILLEYAIHSFIHSFIHLFYLFLFIHLGFTNLFIFFILFICLSIYSFENGTGKQRKTHTTHTHKYINCFGIYMFSLYAQKDWNILPITLLAGLTSLAGYIKFHSLYKAPTRSHLQNMGSTHPTKNRKIAREKATNFCNSERCGKMWKTPVERYQAFALSRLRLSIWTARRFKPPWLRRKRRHKARCGESQRYLQVALSPDCLKQYLKNSCQSMWILILLITTTILGYSLFSDRPKCKCVLEFGVPRYPPRHGILGWHSSAPWEAAWRKLPLGPRNASCIRSLKSLFATWGNSPRARPH